MSLYWQRKKARVPRRVTSRELAPSAAKYLYAVNARSRIKFVRVAHEVLSAHFRDNAKERGGWWVTVAPRQSIFQLGGTGDNEAAEFDIETLQRWVAYEMDGANYVAIVELGYVEHVHEWTDTEKFASWHVHLIAWGGGAANIEHRVARINAKVPSLIPGLDAAHCVPYLNDTLLKRVFYMFKLPRKRARFGRGSASKLPRPAERFRRKIVRKDPLRPGQITQLYDVMGDRVLDKLIFGGGDGTTLVQAINRRALTGLADWERDGLPPRTGGVADSAR